MKRKHRYQDIKDDIDIDALEAAIGFTPLHSVQGNDVGQCLWPQNHTNGDTTGKFALHRDKRVYNCWVCGGGDLLSLAMETQNLDVDQATDWLTQFVYHDTRSDAEFTDYLLALLEDSDERVERMPYFNQRVLERFDGPTDYFESRGISQEIIDRYHLCYGEHIMKPAPRKHIGSEVVKTDDDYFGPTAIFPHLWNGRIVGWQHRWMEWDEGRTMVPRWLAKYTNTTDFPKASTLFNYDAALADSMTQHSPVVVVESVPTVLFLASYDIPAVSFFGSHPKDPQLRLLRRFAHGVILAPDNDATGDELLASTGYLERFIPVFHAEKVDLGPKADLGDYAQTDQPEFNLLIHLQEKVKRVEVTL